MGIDILTPMLSRAFIKLPILFSYSRVESVWRNIDFWHSSLVVLIFECPNIISI